VSIVSIAKYHLGELLEEITIAVTMIRAWEIGFVETIPQRIRV
jgi:hypothetical protein